VNRDGLLGKETIRGDMYLMDMNKTRGHPSFIYDGKYSPVDNHLFATCGVDSTVRFWDVNKKLHGVDM